MPYPAFIAEMEREANRPRLYFGLGSGYVLAASFLLLAILGQVAGLVPARWEFYALVGFKVVTNTLAWWSLRRERWILELQGLNTVTDLVVMTGAIYVTGGVLSPLLPIYVIEIAVLGLLSNLGVTLLMSGVAVALFAAMALLTHAGVLITYPPPVVTAGGVTDRYVVLAIGFATFVIAVPTFFTALILRILRRRERELEDKAAELIEAGKQKSLFMANVTHELRTPIQGICGLSDLVAMGVYGPLTEKQLAAHAGIKESARNLVRLVDDLLLLAKSEAGKLELTPAEVDLAVLVESVAASTRWMLGKKRVTVEVELDDALPVIVTDRGKLNHVLVNLLSNAAKFTPDGGHITVRARREGAEHVSIAVSDTGPGIPGHQLEAIFEEFRQVQDTMEREYGGVGLGLSLVKKLSYVVGATIEVESELDRGTTFTVLLPLRPPADCLPAKSSDEHD